MGRQAQAPEALREHPEAGAMEWQQADFEDAGSLKTAFAGVRQALLVAPNSRQQLTLEKAYIDAAAEAAVDLLVKISSTEVGPHARSAFPLIHAAAEEHIRQQAVPACMLRPDYYLQNMLISAPGIKATGAFHLPFADTRVAPVDSRDVGEAAARIFTGNGHEGSVYSLTGPEVLTFSELAARLSEALGQSIAYVDQPPEAFHAFLSSIVPDPWHVDAVCALFEEIRLNPAPTVSSDLPQLLGRPARSAADFARDYAGAFTGE
jgi:uncharacterized protein YbjT (DUF2867 family)